METIAIFILKHFSRNDEINENYYDILGLDKHNRPSAESVALAYRERSLVTHSEGTSFQKVQEAFEVLSDARKKRIYDVVGAAGLKLITLLRKYQNISSGRLQMYAFLTVLIILLLSPPILVSLKCDGYLMNTSWVLLCLPLWIADVFYVIMSLYVLYHTGVSANSSGRNQILSDMRHFTQIYLALLFQVLLVLRLDKTITWNRFHVLSPWMIWEIVTVLPKIPMALTPLAHPPPHNILQILAEILPEEMYTTQIKHERIYLNKRLLQSKQRLETVHHVLRITFILLLIRKLNGEITISWWLVFVPIFVRVPVYFIQRNQFTDWSSQMLNNLELNEDTGNTNPLSQYRIRYSREISRYGRSGLWIEILISTTSILTVWRIQENSFTVFVIMLPLLLCICGGVCGVLYALSFLSNAHAAVFEDTTTNNSSAGKTLVQDNTMDLETPYISFERFSARESPVLFNNNLTSYRVYQSSTTTTK